MALAEEINSWINIYLKGSALPQDLIRSISTNVDDSSESRGSLTFKLNNASLEVGHLSFKTPKEPNSSEYFELTIKPEANLKRSHIEALWGESWPGVIAPDTFNAVLWFHPFIKPNFEYAGQIEAALDGHPDDAESNVIRVTIMRDDPNTAVSRGNFNLNQSVTTD